MRMRFLLAVAVAALGVLAGCGGGGAGGGSGPAPSASKSEARFDVDLKTGKVTIAPADGRAVYLGGAVSFTSSDVLSVSGDAGKRLIRITAANHSGETWGGAPVKLTVSDVVNADAAALRSSVAVSTYAGAGTYGGADGYRTSAQMGYAVSVCQGQGPLAGSLIVPSEFTVRRIDPGGSVSTLAGQYPVAGATDGTGAAARFYYARDAACDSTGNTLVADVFNRRIRRVTPLGEVTTIAGTGVVGGLDGLGSVATFSNPDGIAVSADGDRIYVADQATHTIRMVRYVSGPRELPTSYTVTTIAGVTGSSGFVDGSSARFSSPRSLALVTDHAGVETLFVCDTTNNAIRRIASPAGVPTVSTVAGDGTAGDTDGPGGVARLRSPGGIAAQWIDDSSFVLYVTDSYRVRAITFAAGGSPTQKGSYNVMTLAGATIAGSTDGDGNTARFGGGFGLTAVGTGAGGTLYLADPIYNRVRQMTVPGGALHSGGSATPVTEPVRVTNWDSELPNRTAWTKTMTAAAGAWTADLQLYVPAGVTGFSFLATIETDSNMTNLPAAGASFVSTLAGGSVSAFADGSSRQARFTETWGVAAVPAAMRGFYRAPSGAPIRAFVVDRQNLRIRYIDTNGYVGTWAGSSFGTADGVGITAQFTSLCACALCPDGSLLVTDENRIRRIWPNQQVTQLAGDGAAGIADGVGSAAEFSLPTGLAVTNGWQIYVADAGNYTIRRIEITGADPRSSSSYTVTTVAGLPGSPGLVDDVGPAARFGALQGLAADTDGRVYVADYGNNAVRVLTLSSPTRVTVTTLAGGQAGPMAVAVDAAHNVYLARYNGRSIGRINPGGVPVTLAGDGVQDLTDGAPGRLWGPRGLAVEDTGTLLFSDASALRSASRIIDTAAP